jgi:hypothetical protein
MFNGRGDGTGAVTFSSPRRKGREKPAGRSIVIAESFLFSPWGRRRR